MGRLALVLACLTACGSEPPSQTWEVVRQDETASLLAVWGSSAQDVWVVGGRTALDGGPTVLRYQDHAWSRVDTGQTTLDLWWAFGVAPDDVFFGGSNGTILRFRGGSFEKQTTPPISGVVFGIWGASSNDVWAVGDGGAAGAIVWHFDGTQWTSPALPAGTPSRVFKVHGRASNDVWMSCGDGSMLHWDGATLERQLTGVDTPLFSVVTTPDDVVAVGGVLGQGQILEGTGADWQVNAFASPVAWRGIAGLGDTVYALGEDGAVAERVDGTWRVVPQPLIQKSFHAGWVDPDGGLWAVGGEFDRAPLTARGFITYYGTDTIEEVQP
ncbi:MAG TPA: hypothetical protein VFQ53_06925 [Kofleriaceae bacterium]|nr:hypothetical protein [Kofleriaceae bacterium]